MKFYTKYEVAEILKMHPRTIGRYLINGDLHGARVRKGWIISEEDLNEFYERCKAASQPLNKINEKE